MAGGVSWDAAAVSRAITILNDSSENVASRTLRHLVTRGVMRQTSQHRLRGSIMS